MILVTGIAFLALLLQYNKEDVVNLKALREKPYMNRGKR